MPFKKAKASQDKRDVCAETVTTGRTKQQPERIKSAVLNLFKDEDL